MLFFHATTTGSKLLTPTMCADGINGLVLDAELVAVDRSDGKVRLRAFQELSTRARGGVTTDQVLIPSSVFT